MEFAYNRRNRMRGIPTESDSCDGKKVKLRVEPLYREFVAELLRSFLGIT